MRWQGLVNLLLTAAGWGLGGFIAAITTLPTGTPWKAAFSVAGVAALGAIVNHLRQQPELWKPLL